MQKGLEILRRVLGEEHPHTAASYSNVVANLAVQGQDAEAEAVLRRAIFSYEASRQSGAVGLDRASIGRFFNPRLFLAALQQAREPALAWDEVELSLARGLLDEQDGGKLPFTAEEQAAREHDQLRVAAWQPQILALVTKSQRTDEENAKLEQIIRERRAAQERLAALAAAASARSVAAGAVIREALPEDAALLLWVDLATTNGDIQEHFACVVRRAGDPKWERLAGTGPNGKWTKADKELLGKFRDSLAEIASSGEFESLAKELHSQRIAPALRHLSGVKTLYVIPANKMAGVPVEALTKDFTISYIPSGTFLARAQQRAPPVGKKMLAVGDPVFDRPDNVADIRGQWKELPGTRVELSNISRLYGTRASILVDSAASEESLEVLRKQGDLAKFRYLHFATHGKGNRTRAFESALILSQDKLPAAPLLARGEPFLNGQLSAREVLDYWKLDAELVTLSACETAVGKQGGGDGNLGFAQAFLTAGARSVCLSLWKVDDAATSLLMQRFYQNLLGKRPGLDKPMGKAAALDEAKRWLRELSTTDALKFCADMTNGVARGTRGKDEDLKLVVPADDSKGRLAKDAKPFADPRYWAAFILIGDPN